ncbi:MAG TPA: hypothetical protein GXX67_12810 [Petrimonas sp.]|nr:hypothetical protein [Petrimonas sp.]
MQPSFPDLVQRSFTRSRRIPLCTPFQSSPVDPNQVCLAHLGRGIRCSKKRVTRLMRQANLVGVHRRRLKGCTKQDPLQPSFPDLVQRSFTAAAPNQLWVADITQHTTGEGWLYLSCW